MPAALVVETGAVVAGANTWISRANATTYFDSRLRSTTWTAASTSDQDRALLEAAVLLTNLVEWDGELVDSTQDLPFPRNYLYTPDRVLLDGTTIPQFLKDAQCELAIALLAGSRTADQETGLRRGKADVVEAEFDKYDRPHTLSRRVRQLIAPYGRIRGRGGREVERA